MLSRLQQFVDSEQFCPSSVDGCAHGTQLMVKPALANAAVTNALSADDVNTSPVDIKVPGCQKVLCMCCRDCCHGTAGFVKRHQALNKAINSLFHCRCELL